MYSFINRSAEMSRTSEDKENQHQSQRAPTAVFRNGSIVKIVLNNFLTYDHVVCKPGPYLNVIIGPNGTGKSSIICGICLAMGGLPKILGRSDEITDFVKHGKLEGFVTLEIWDSERKRTKVFSIKIDTRKKTALYTIDGRITKISELREEVKRYNIQIDNPCTFLAQDKVKSFAEQGAGKLLLNTEKAGPSNLIQIHNKLKETSTQGIDYEEKLGRLKKNLERIELDLKTKKARADNYHEWANRNKILNLIKIKKALIDYNQQLEQQRDKMASVDEVKLQLDAAKSRLAPTEKSLKNVQISLNQIKEKMTELEREKDRNIQKIKKLSDHSQMDENLERAADQLTKVENDYNNWDKEKEIIADNYRKFKDLYDKTNIEYVPNLNLKKVETEIKNEIYRQKQEEQNILERQNFIYRRDNDLQTKENNQRYSLETKIRNIVKFRNKVEIMNAWEYYTKNQEKFAAPIYVPYLHVNIPDNNNLIFFNNVINTRDLGIFIFSCKEDQDLMLSKFQIDSTIVPQSFIDNFKNTRAQISCELKQLGFFELLLNLFKAPDSVIAYLNGHYNLDRILIGGFSVDNDYENLCQRAKQIDSGYTLFLTRKYRIEVSFSRFNPQKVYVERRSLNGNFRFDIQHTRQFSDSIDAELQQLQEDKIKLKEQITKLEADKVAYRELSNKFRNEMLEETRKKNQIDQLREQLQRFEDRLQRFSQDKPDLTAAKLAYEQIKRKLAQEALLKFSTIVALMEEQRELINRYAFNFDEYMRLEDRRKTFERIIEEQKNANYETQRLYQDKLKKLEAIRKDVDYVKKQFRELTQFYPNESEMNEEEKKEFNKLNKDFEKNDLPNDMDKLDQLANKEHNKAMRGRQEGTLKDVEECEKLVKDKTEVELDIKKTEERDKKWKQSMNTSLNDWLEQLRNLVNQINYNFSHFFEQLGCAGEVRLDEPENKYNVDDYGIKIFVKFRNGACFRELNPQTQSGGERSVATMLYIMALQNLCSVPFRCVDEINQGMDPINERAVFNMMVNLLNTGGNVSETQYFLLTPKLLSGLNFNERVTVHIVHNGPAIDNPEQWDPERFFNGI